MKNMTDEKLYELCKMYGARALEWRRKFIGLLPEVNRRKLYEKKGFGSIFEFAAKLAGVSKEQVQRVLQLERNFEDKPALREALVSGKISANKLARIASVATIENQEILMNQAEQLSKAAVETFVRDIKFANQNGLFKTQNDGNSVPGHRIENLKLSTEVIAKLSVLQNKGIDVNELILEFLEKREQEIEEKKAEIVREFCEREKAGKATTRYIPSKVKKVLDEEFGKKCAVPNCKKMSKTLHHTARFGLIKAHNPYLMAPLCHEHHVIAHSLDVNFQKQRSLATSG